MTTAKKSFPLDAVVAGYLGVDITPGFPATRRAIPAAELFRPGRLIETEGLIFSLGGVVANTGLAMKRFGQKVELMGSIGCDALGEIVMAQLKHHQAVGGVRQNRRAGTAYGIIVAPPGMDRIIFEDPGCNGVFTAQDIDFKKVAQSRLFHFGYPPLMEKMWVANGAELRKLFRRVRRLGVATSLDMTLPDADGPAGKANWRKILAGVLPFVDIFVPSVEEILFMLEPEQYARILAKAAGRDMVDVIPQELYERLAERMLALGAKVALIKAGHRGAYLQTGDVAKLNAATALELPAGNWSRRKLWIGSFPTDPRRIKNACGAGDCAVAGFLTAVLKGVEIEPAAQYAMLAGRDNLYGLDAFAGLSDWKEMTRCLARQTRAAKR
ncbi:MAG: carbohydrate kinase family protein [Verrucomicrobia bacterium]|nr:carbohydrate kinase family protein [Verrucomicrobiota bacterium]